MPPSVLPSISFVHSVVFVLYCLLRVSCFVGTWEKADDRAVYSVRSLAVAWLLFIHYFVVSYFLVFFCVESIFVISNGSCLYSAVRFRRPTNRRFGWIWGSRFRLTDWLIKDWLIDWLKIGWLIDWILIDWLINWLIDWLIFCCSFLSLSCFSV